MNGQTERLTGGDAAVQCPQMAMTLRRHMDFSQWNKLSSSEGRSRQLIPEEEAAKSGGRIKQSVSHIS